MLRRFAFLTIIASLSTLVLFTFLTSSSWRNLPQAIGLGESQGPTEEQKQHALPDLRISPSNNHNNNGTSPPATTEEGLVLVPEPGTGFKEPKIESHSPYPIGTLKPPGSNYTRTLVITRTQSEDTSWIEQELGDWLRDGVLRPAVYTVDDPSAALTVPANKGHEVMVYLTYIIDHYDKDGRDGLADVNIFMHAHREAWHNNLLLDNDASRMVRALSPERVTRDGYMNLRCHWDPGCPDWLRPGEVQRNVNKQEEWLLADSWAELFPLDPIPTVLAQPCCAQFAVSRDRIRALPRERYVHLREWVLKTELDDFLSGRVFEYVWQWIFTLDSRHCPSMSACYCDGYGLCFGTAKDFDYYFELRFQREEYKERLRVWREKARLIEDARMHAKDGKIYEEAILEIPKVGEDVWLLGKMKELGENMDARMKAAVELGRSPAQRAKEAGRLWQEGDGF